MTPKKAVLFLLLFAALATPLIHRAIKRKRPPSLFPQGIAEVATAKAATRWLREAAIPISGDEAQDQCHAVAMQLGDSGSGRVVALGESTHGTHEFFEARIWVTECLIRHFGFRTLAIEGSAPASEAVNDYVLTGRGDPRESLRATGFWNLYTQEMLTLLEWLKSYNSTADAVHRVRFVGIDPQGITPALGSLHSILGSIRPDLMAGLDSLRHAQELQFASKTSSAPSAGEIDARLTRAHRFVTDVLADSQRLATALDTERLARTLRFAALVEQSELSLLKPSLRDSLMAVNVIRAVATGPEGVILWAHNAHIRKERETMQTGPASMGRFLDEFLGLRYVAIGMSFDEGGFLAVNTTTHSLDPIVVPKARAGTVEAVMSGVHANTYFIGFGSRPAGGVTEWLQTPHLMRNFGSAVWAGGGEQQVASRLRKEFDGFVFVHRTTPVLQIAH